MLKFVDSTVVFQEIPDETTLAVSLSNCPCRCPGCHSRYLWDDVGRPLDNAALDTLMEPGRGVVSCICFMGGDADPDEVQRLAHHVRQVYPAVHVAWYSGRTCVAPQVDRSLFDYIKVGPYIAHLGPLSSPRTNQRLFKRQPDNSWQDITSRFWKERHQET
ncbi:MAG: anaerobic ribonucleoside-triphosphate reductase activating protein [bacterium P3]|nr:MAG: anaerobic ribonucleoside-triphosphate reductase activating protein [bacterium P3]KWW42122.1 MAG: anaerobic ribonucleoside-triphosphate reductase activating protein [bacterium F083]